MVRTAAVVCGLALLAGCGKNAPAAASCQTSVMIEVAYPGASPFEVEQDVLQVLEDLAREAGARETYAVAEAGRAHLVLVPRGNADELARAVRERLDRGAALPESAEPPMVHVVTPGRLHIVAVRGEPGATGLHAVAASVRHRLLAEPGVRRVELLGERGPELRVEVDPARLAAAGLTLDELVTAVGSQVALPRGAVEAGDRELLIRTTGRLDPAELAEMVIAVRAATPILLRDVARSRETPQRSPAGTDGAPSWLLAVDAPEPPRSLPLDALSPGVSLELVGDLAPRCDPVELVASGDTLVEAAVSLVARTAMGGPARGADASHRVRLSHPDRAQLLAATAALQHQLGAGWTSTGLMTSSELSMRLGDRAGTLGITPAQLATIVRAATGGVEVARLQRGPDELRVVVALGDAEATPEQLLALPIVTPTGELLPLSAVAKVEVQAQPARIERRDGRRVAYLIGQGRPDPAVLREARAALIAAHPGLEIE